MRRNAGISNLDVQNITMRTSCHSFWVTPIILVCLIASCSKEGPMGPEGPVGLVGPDGPPGKTGSIDVVTDTFTLSNADFINANYWFTGADNVAVGYPARAYHRSNTKITKDILDKGMVLAYFRARSAFNDPGWLPLPVTFVDIFGGNYIHNFTFNLQEGKASFYYYFSGLKATTPPNVYNYSMPQMKVKLVIVPGKAMTELNLKRENPEVITQLLDLNNN